METNFLDDKLFKFAISFPTRESLVGDLLINKLYDLCNEHWLSIIRRGIPKSIVISKINQTIKYWDLFLIKLKANNQRVYNIVMSYEHYSDFIKKTESFKKLSK